jgi:hypothetical protein
MVTLWQTISEPGPSLNFPVADNPLRARSFCRDATWMKETKAVAAVTGFHLLQDMALCYPEPEGRIVVRRFGYLVAARSCRASPSKQAVFQSSNNVARCFRKNSIAGRFHPSTFSMIPKHASCRATAATLRLPGLLGPKRPAHARPLRITLSPLRQLSVVPACPGRISPRRISLHSCSLYW